MPGHVLLMYMQTLDQNIQFRQKLLGNILSGSLLQLCPLLAVPFAFGPIFRRQPHALKVKPLDGTVLVVTGNHLTKRNTLTVTIDWLTRVYSCWNGICCPCIASKRSSQMIKMHSGVCIAPLPPAAVFLWSKTYIHLAQVDQHKALWVCQEASSALPGDCLRFKTDTTCTSNIIPSLQGWCCDEVKIQTQCKKIDNSVRQCHHACPDKGLKVAYQR